MHQAGTCVFVEPHHHLSHLRASRWTISWPRIHITAYVCVALACELTLILVRQVGSMFMSQIRSDDMSEMVLN